MLCRATECQDQAVVSGLCEAHYLEWRSVIDKRKTVSQYKAELEEKYDLQKEPAFRNLGDFR